MKTFRSSHPQRTYSGPRKTNYQSYREQLARDFNHRCGYTDCRDMWWAGGVQIDHFAPQKPNIKDAAKAAIDAGKTKYTAPDGIPELKQAIEIRAKDFYINQLGQAESEETLRGRIVLQYSNGQQVLIISKDGQGSQIDILIKSAG